MVSMDVRAVGGQVPLADQPKIEMKKVILQFLLKKYQPLCLVRTV